MHLTGRKETDDWAVAFLSPQPPFVLLSLDLAVEAFRANGSCDVPNSAREERSGN